MLLISHGLQFVLPSTVWGTHPLEDGLSTRNHTLEKCLPSQKLSNVNNSSIRGGCSGSPPQHRVRMDWLGLVQVLCDCCELMSRQRVVLSRKHCFARVHPLLLFFSFFKTGFLCVTALTVLELALVDQAVLRLTEIHLPLSPKCWN